MNVSRSVDENYGSETIIFQHDQRIKRTGNIKMQILHFQQIYFKIERLVIGKLKRLNSKIDVKITINF